VEIQISVSQTKIPLFAIIYLVDSFHKNVEVSINSKEEFLSYLILCRYLLKIIGI